MEVETASLDDDLDEEVDMRQLEGFVFSKNEKKVYKLIKSLYSTKQVPKKWQGKFNSIILSNEFTHNSADTCVYSKFTDSYGVIICLYVDNLLILGPI